MSHDTTEVMYEYTNTGGYIPQNVTHVRFHPSVTKIGKEGAFKYCDKLREVALNDGLREIGKKAFGYCTSLQRINIPSTVTKINNGAFYGCKSLVEVVLNDGLREIGNSAFQDCTALQSINIPSTVTKIGNHSFYNGTNLSEVALSDGIKKIGHTAFANCTALESITIPFTVLDIDNNAFSKCTHLRDVVLSDGVEKIKERVFEKCTSLQQITIPSTVIEIEKYAFTNCSRLREVVIYNEEVQIGAKSLTRCTSLERFKFPSLFTRLNNVIQAGQRDIEAKMDDISAVEWRDGELVIPAVRQVRVTDTLVEIDKEKLSKIVRLIRYYEIKEATTLFELALWKAKINQAEDATDINRDACRIEVPGPVKDAILQYL